MSKKIISVLLALAIVIGCFSIAITAKEEVQTKVSFTATSNETDFLIGEVLSDYSAKVTVPLGSVINAGEVSGSLTMTDIASLGIEGTRTYEKSITTGVEKEVLLDNYLPAFTNATVSGAIDGNSYFYNVNGIMTEDSYTIEAVPADVEAARAAFRVVTSHVTSSTKAEDDSYAEVPGTAYVQIGTEKLSLENTEETLKLDNIVQGTGLKAEIRSAVKLEEAEELEDAQVEVYLPAGTVLAMGQSVVELNDSATIKMYGYEDNDDVNTILSKLRDCETNEEIILTAVLFISDFANSIEGQDLVVNVDFEEHVHEYEEAVTEATCTEDGYTTYTCACGDTYEADYVTALGHTEGDSVVVDATAIKDGSKTTYCSACGEIVSDEIIEKAEGKVVFTAQSNSKTVLTGVVSEDYSAKVTVPMGSVINAGEVTGSLAMTDIASLGIEGTRTYEKSITTGVEKEVLLDNYLPAFTNATVSGAIDGNSYFYNVNGVVTEDSYTIEAVPADVEAARAAFRAVTSHVTSSTKAEDDSYAEVPGTAYVQIGTEKLSLENTEETLKLDNIVQGTGLKAEIRSAVKLEEAEELEDAQVEVYLPAGTVLAMGQSVVELNDSATIKMYGYEDNDDVNTILSKLRDCETNEEIILTAVLFISDFANSIEGQDLVVNVDFEDAGTTVSGTVESFVFEDAATVELLSEGEVIQSISVEGSGVQDYSFENVVNGTYTLKVSKLNHVTREYEISVDGEEVTAELKIHLIGDVTGDGRVNTVDVSMANAQAKGVVSLSEYELACADVTDDGKVNTIDVSFINGHAKKVTALW